MELGFGEVTTLIALNFEGIYRLPVTAQQGRWAVYAGGGPALNFSKLGFSDEELEEDFDDFDMDVGVNVFLGMQSRNGMFLEMKGTAYSTPHLRFQIGYNFY